MKIGQYGKFNNEWYIVVDVRGDKLLIINGDGVKKQIASKNFDPKEGSVAPTTRYEGTDYIITKTNKIISLTTNKYMKWDDNHPIRKGILAVKGIERVKQMLKYDQMELAL
jgi:hypothetical protein